METQKIHYLAIRDNKKTLLHLPLEFEGARAFAVWDAVRLGEYQFKARIELDPRRLRRTRGQAAQFRYSGKLDLPLPETN